MSSNPHLELVRDEHRKIKIDTVSGGEDKHELKHCYFYPTDEPHVYMLCNKDDEILASDIRNEQPFEFHYDGHLWKIPFPAPGFEPFLIDDRAASGSWWNDHKPGIPEEEGGTFTAQASGGLDEENNSYATAS